MDPNVSESVLSTTVIPIFSDMQHLLCSAVCITANFPFVPPTGRHCSLFPSKHVDLSVLDDSGVKVFVVASWTADSQLVLLSKTLNVEMKLPPEFQSVSMTWQIRPSVCLSVRLTPANGSRLIPKYCKSTRYRLYNTFMLPYLFMYCQHSATLLRRTRSFVLMLQGF